MPASSPCRSPLESHLAIDLDIKNQALSQLSNGLGEAYGGGDHLDHPNRDMKEPSGATA